MPARSASALRKSSKSAPKAPSKAASRSKSKTVVKAKPKATTRASAKAPKLPEWNLTDLYPAIDAPEVKLDLERLDE